MKKGIVIRLYPNDKQAILINKSFGCARFIYNTLLDFSKKNRIVNRFKLQKQITFLKTKDEFAFLKEVDKFALQNACKNLYEAYQNFFEKRARFPKFKKKKKDKRSYQTNMTNNNISLNDGYIKLPKLGYIKCSSNYQDSINKIINVTVSQDLDGKYYASIIYETNINPLPKTNNSIGIDLGTRKLVTTNNGQIYKLPKSIFNLTKKIKREQRRLSRRVYDSNNFNKQRIILSKIYKRRTNSINDFLHKLSYSLVKNNDTIYMEDLDINQLLQIQENKKKKNKMIISSLGKLSRLISYKALMYDKQVLKIDRYYPSSKLCSTCGNIYDVNDKEKYCCPHCGLTIDRDINAAINIINKGKLSFSI